MAAYVFFNGNLTKDPVQRTVSDRTVTTFSVATDTTRKDQAGKYITNFFDVSVWGNSGNYVMNNAEKGTNVNVIGELTVEDYTDKNGVARKAVRITANNVQILARKKSAGGEASGSKAESKVEEATQSKNDLPF